MYSAADYMEMFIIYGECGRNAREAARVFSQRFPDRNHPDHKVILSAIARTIETAHVLPNRKEIGGHARDVRTVENEEAILDAFEDGTTSVREVARNLNISRTSVHRVMKTERRHPFHYTRVQNLQPEDYPARREFCTWLLNQAENNPNFVSRIMFSDESIFGRQGCYNAHNWHIWAEENPNALFPRAFQERFSVNLWAGVLGNRVVGPFEFPARLTGDIYAEFLDADLPNLLDNVPLHFRVNDWLQHDGAPPHYSREVRQALNRLYPDRWIGRGGPQHWPARSPDLNPLDFFLWGHVKNVVYRDPIATEEQLRDRIQMAFVTITPQMVTNSKLSLLRRARLCLEMNGGHFEHLL